ncbi:hypothetical protein NC653_028525 [Populus alba x Populus x berolinensis]|uniref:STML2-like C-terminal extension domain-containing protein n=1 Tax=Populus alba x Populus x berolinensis TaxID=444605 RepID=A0AAD6M0D3_9ROSI|nr:hypothetical protein NC653_028525 [Populus alba x Populus x berolinensis]
MEMQAEAERRKRAQILESEGERQANINIADGHKSAQILASQGEKQALINKAQGEAEAIIAKAQATAKGIAIVSENIKKSGGIEAASLKIAEQYVGAFGNIAKEGTTILLPSATGNPANIMAQAFTMYKNLLGSQKENSLSIPWLHTAVSFVSSIFAPSIPASIGSSEQNYSAAAYV